MAHNNSGGTHGHLIQGFLYPGQGPLALLFQNGWIAGVFSAENQRIHAYPGEATKMLGINSVAQVV
jgi:hypothetical protein